MVTFQFKIEQTKLLETKTVRENRSIQKKLILNNNNSLSTRP